MINTKEGHNTKLRRERIRVNNIVLYLNAQHGKEYIQQNSQTFLNRDWTMHENAYGRLAMGRQLEIRQRLERRFGRQTARTKM